MFIDLVRVHVIAGTGGSGCTSFRREWRMPMGGPDGGDGGRGGDIIIKGDSNLATLLDYTYKDKWTGERGEHGMGNDKTGRSGESKTMPVPLGTIVKDAGSGEILGEIVEDGEEFVVCKGGRGGKGNAFFVTATHQAPREWQPGEEGQERNLELELKLIADIGLVGQPNAGKSTLLSVVSAARPKIADYPFTTLSPNLGVVQMSGGRTFVIADIPGIIEGAHEGKGLGLTFLRHIERTRILAFMIPIDAMDVQEEYDKLRAEIRAYSPELATRPHCVVFTKMDLAGGDTSDYTPDLKTEGAFAVYSISAPARMGLEELKDGFWKKGLELKKAAGVIPSGGPRA